MELMGDINFWNYLGFMVIGKNDKKTSHKNVMTNIKNGSIKNDKPIGIYSGTHWISVKANEIDEFDPYDEFQVPSSNQFCQTFSMMYLLDKLPEKITDKQKCFTKFYTYTEKALEFIEEIINTHIDNYYEHMTNIKIQEIKDSMENVNNIEEQKQEIIIKQNRERDDTKIALIECRQHPNICLNSIEFDNFSSLEAQKKLC